MENNRSYFRTGRACDRPYRYRKRAPGKCLKPPALTGRLGSISFNPLFCSGFRENARLRQIDRDKCSNKGHFPRG